MAERMKCGCAAVVIVCLTCCGTIAVVVPPLGGVAYYPSSGNANDDWGAHHGTVYGATLTADRWANPDSAYLFEASGGFSSGDYIEVPGAGDLSGMPQLKVSCEFKANAWPVYEVDDGSATLVSKFNNGDSTDSTDSYYLALHKRNGLYTIQAGILNESETKITLTGEVAPSLIYDWHDLALTYDGGTVRLWLDGNQLDAQPFSGAVNSTASPLTIGHMHGSSAHNLYFNGIIDEVKIYDVPEPCCLVLLSLGGLTLARKGRS